MVNASSGVATQDHSERREKLRLLKSTFLAHRVEADTDEEAENKIGRTHRTIQIWDKDDPEFKLLHQAAKEASIGRQEMALENAPIIDITMLNTELDGASVDAMARLREIVGIPIHRGMKAADVAQIRLASEKLLEATGILKPRETSGTQVNVIVGEFAKAGKEFDPPWKHRKVVDVEGKVS
jgi:hypothetical protein